MKPKLGRAGSFCLGLAETSCRARLPRESAAAPVVKWPGGGRQEVPGSDNPPKPVALWADTLATPLGELLIVCDADALCVVDYDCFDDRVRGSLLRRYGPYELVRTLNPRGATVRLERYFAGDLGAIDTLRVNPGGTPCQRRVWEALRTIPPGQTRSYGQLAAQVGGTHARAVGHANSLNPVAIVVPCHRVIGADATLTGYAGGLARKRWLLDHEGVAGALPLPF
jgi:methylated-DNA-[protein]-cysteine S-methyltransferase